MKLTRTLACLGVSVVAAGGLALSANSATATHSHFTVIDPVTVGQGQFRLDGRVVDQGGRLVQDAKVKLFKESNPSSTTPNASALTYPGYFRFSGLRRGHFSVFFSKSGYEKTAVEGLTVGPRNPFVRLGDVLLQKKLVDSDTDLALSPKGKIRANDKVGVTVTVTSEEKPTGKVELYLDNMRKPVDEYKLVKSDKGVADFDLGKLAKGDYTVKASYAGNIFVLESNSGKIDFTVLKKKR